MTTKDLFKVVHCSHRVPAQTKICFEKIILTTFDFLEAKDTIFSE